MNNKPKWDSAEAFLLNECYTLSSTIVNDNETQKLLREKADKINVPSEYIPLFSDASYTESEMQILTKAIKSLAEEGHISSSKDDSQTYFKVSQLHESAEKEYVLALLSLRNATNETQRLAALQHLSVALSYSPDDPRYITLSQIIKEASE